MQQLKTDCKPVDEMNGKKPSPEEEGDGFFGEGGGLHCGFSTVIGKRARLCDLRWDSGKFAEVFVEHAGKMYRHFMISTLV